MQSLSVELNNLLQSASQTYQSGKDFVKELFEDMPDNTADKAIAGAALSFCIATVFTGSAALGVTYGACAATAAVVDGLVNPFFEEHFSRGGVYTDSGKTIKNVVSLIIASAVVSTVTGTSIPLIVPIVCIAAYNIFCLPYQNGWDTDSSSTYLVI